MKSLNTKKQQGISALGIMTAILVGSFVFICGYKTIPAYYDDFLIRKALKSLVDKGTGEVSELSKTQAQRELSNFYMMNNISGPKTKALRVKRFKEKTIYDISYEVREHLFGNIEIVLTFENQLDTSKPFECCEKQVEFKKFSEEK